MFGSPPPCLAAMMMARLSLLQSLPRLASIAPFLCLIVAQCECPDMPPPAVGGGKQPGVMIHYSTPKPRLKPAAGARGQARKAPSSSSPHRSAESRILETKTNPDPPSQL